MFAKRVSGILLHPTSLPSNFGIGDLGKSAYNFVDFLKETGQSLWQVLPLGHISFGNSPYMCLSAFAGNPYMISPQKLVDDGYLDLPDIGQLPDFPSHRVDYGLVIDYKMNLFKKSFNKFKETTHPSDYYIFCEENSFWLEDYALFVSLKYVHDLQPWPMWKDGSAKRDPERLVYWRKQLAEDIDFWKFVQYLFFKQWNDLKQYCEQKGISIIGDIPVYVAHDSAEVWANSDLFFLNDDGNPLVVSGVPPDYFSSTGQRWGNPIYCWEKMEERGFLWWIDRLKINFSMLDIVRLDHFRGFEAYWEISAEEPTAENGRWVKGPGIKLFDAVHNALDDVKMIAEDLGVITEEVDALRDELGYPGMRILQMAFGTDPKASEYRPHNHIHNCAVYTASHDHNTTVGWFTAEPGSQSTQSVAEIEAERALIKKYLDTNGEKIHWDMIRLAMSSVARICVIPLQDVLGLGTEARMNLPGTSKNNWEWRFNNDLITNEIKSKLLDLTTLYER